MANERTGIYGTYYGSYFDDSEHLSDAEMKVNARYIYSSLLDSGWTVNAISALLGNMQAESSLNPGRWQSEDIGNTSMGYGLVQWTPASKYINWCSQNGYSDPSSMDNNINRILYELENDIQWYATSSYNFSFYYFSRCDDTPSYLAKAFLLNYERPADQSESVQNYRGSLANSWYEYLTGVTPEEPTDPEDPENPDTPVNPDTSKKKRKGYNFLVLNARRRRNQWIRKNFLK